MEPIDPLPWVTGEVEDDAVRQLATYLTGYSGRWFEPLAELSDPNVFEATDIVAVSCLKGVESLSRLRILDIVIWMSEHERLRRG